MGFEGSEVGERLSKHDGYFSEDFNIRRHATDTYTYPPPQAKQYTQLGRESKSRKQQKAQQQ